MYYINCKNCGAPLHYDINNYGKFAKCDYCNSEYHIDNKGKIEEYKVKLDIQGKERNFYIQDIKVNPIFEYCGRDISGKIYCKNSQEKLKITLIEI